MGNACYGESCDFWVKEWGVSCSLVQVITTTFPDSVTTSNFNDGTGGYKAVCEAAYGVTLGIYTASSNTWDTDCAVSATASSRRGSLSITYTATISSAESAAATTAANSLDAATFNST